MEFYHSAFPNWKIVRNDTLVREDGPVLQGITFDRLSGGDYRPIGHIRVMVAPEDVWGYELTQDLNIKVRHIERRAHEMLKNKVVEAIHAEFVPRVDQPLHAQEVLNLYEQRAVPTSPEAYSLAPLNAYLGNDSRALYWCSRFSELVDAVSNPWQDSDYKRRAFLDQLEKWLQAGNAKQQLERVLQEERRKWGLA
jgi:hypothetical protein